MSKRYAISACQRAISMAMEVHGAMGISAELGLDDAGSGDAAQLLLSIISLCWFPLIHAHTVVPAVGVDLERSGDFERRKRHVVSLVLDGLGGLTRTTAPTLAEAESHD